MVNSDDPKIDSEKRQRTLESIAALINDGQLETAKELTSRLRDDDYYKYSFMAHIHISRGNYLDAFKAIVKEEELEPEIYKIEDGIRIIFLNKVAYDYLQLFLDIYNHLIGKDRTNLPDDGVNKESMCSIAVNVANNIFNLYKKFFAGKRKRIGYLEGVDILTICLNIVSLLNKPYEKRLIEQQLQGLVRSYEILVDDKKVKIHPLYSRSSEIIGYVPSIVQIHSWQPVDG